MKGGIAPCQTMYYIDCMAAVTKRDLNQHTAQVLDQADAEGAVTVTERGVARWRIEPVTAPADPIARLAAEGRIIPAAAQPVPWGPVNPHRSPADVDRLLNELRADANDE